MALTHSVAEDGLELLMLLLRSLAYRHVPPHPGRNLHFLNEVAKICQYTQHVISLAPHNTMSMFLSVQKQILLMEKVESARPPRRRASTHRL